METQLHLPLGAMMTTPLIVVGTLAGLAAPSAVAQATPHDISVPEPSVGTLLVVGVLLIVLTRVALRVRF